jgi:hypothetical protein
MLALYRIGSIRGRFGPRQRRKGLTPCRGVTMRLSFKTPAPVLTTTRVGPSICNVGTGGDPMYYKFSRRDSSNC